VRADQNFTRSNGRTVHLRLPDLNAHGVDNHSGGLANPVGAEPGGGGCSRSTRVGGCRRAVKHSLVEVLRLRENTYSLLLLTSA